MKVGWLLDAGVFDAYHDELAVAIVRQGGEVVSLNRPDPPYGWDDAPDAYRKAFPVGACVVTHADIDLVQRVLSDRRWAPAAFASVNNFFCSRYFAHLGKYLLNQDYVMLPFGELRRCEEFLFATLGHQGKIFVRPDSPLKLFTGLVVSRETFEKDLEFMAFYDVPGDALVVVSSPKVISKEWRFVVVEGTVVAGSQYKEGEQLVHRANYDQQAWTLAQAIASGSYAPDPAWVLDICQTPAGDYHLLEIGGFSFASLYACNKDEVVKAVSEAARKVWSQGQS